MSGKITKKWANIVMQYVWFGNLLIIGQAVISETYLKIKVHQPITSINIQIEIAHTQQFIYKATLSSYPSYSTH